MTKPTEPPMQQTQQNVPTDLSMFPNLKYLENVTGPEALKFAEDHNKISNGRLKSDPRYSKTFDDIYQILSAKDKLPGFYLMNNEIYSFWQDDVHAKGLLRKTSVHSLNTGHPEWEVILDVDQLAQNENKNWVYKGILCLEPDYELCLLSLSDGGKDAVTLREFNLKTKSFVADGFYIPESKSNATWYDKDTLLVGDGTDNTTLTSSGYPSQVKLLHRGDSLDKAPVIFTCNRNSMSVYVSSKLLDSGERFTSISDQLSFYESLNYILNFDEKKLIKIPIPTSANFETVFKGQVLFSTREPLDNYRAGSVLSFPLSEVESYHLEMSQIFKPSATEFFEGLTVSKNHVYIGTLQDVKSKITQLSFENNHWKNTHLQIGSAQGNTSLATAENTSDNVYYFYYDFLTPTSVFHFDETKKEAPKSVLKTPARFDSHDLTFAQYKVKSKDGTLIPYFLVHKKNMKYDSKNPTLLYGYGGFEIPMTSNYLSATGKAWLEKGGVYALANLRGGGEYGPDWHQSVIRENRHKIYEDFYAIAEDLIHKKITSPEKLGIKGGSNGGLLTSVALIQRPELFKAVISEVPLTNMMEYHHWLAGASWMDEYGSPDDPMMRAYLLTYSPLHNVKKDVKYPEAFYLTSTKDDRVHPAHARQMVAHLEELGHPVLYNENTDGGHGRATNVKEMAEFMALEFTYLYQKLF